MKGFNKYQPDSSLLDSISLKREKFQIYSHKKDQKSGYKKKSSSLMSIYPSKLKDVVCPQIITENKSTYQSIQDTRKNKTPKANSPIGTIDKRKGEQVNGSIDVVH